MDGRAGRRRFLAAAGLGLSALAGCLGGDSGGSRSPSSGTEGPRGASDGVPPTTGETLPLPLERATIREAAVSGGVSKDGIPAIEEPSFEPATDADGRLDPGDPVFGVVGDDEVKAYPQSILVYHEICNDELSGRPVGVTYCPLTGTAMGFHRGETSFGVSGWLLNNNLIMYDRATETWWPQVLATGVPGPWNEAPPARSLVGFPVVWTTWSRWRDAHPETTVLTRETGFVRNYDADPYGDYNPRRGYYRPDAQPMFRVPGGLDDRFPPKAVVVGARTPEGAVAFLKEGLRSARVLGGDLAGTPVLAVHDERLDTVHLYRNPDGSAFEPGRGAVLGPDGTSYPAGGLPLEPLLAIDAMWFAWAGFYPGSNVYA